MHTSKQYYKQTDQLFYIQLVSNYTKINNYFRCNMAMWEVPRNDTKDKYSWWCRECKGRKSIRTGRFFQKIQRDSAAMEVNDVLVDQYITDAAGGDTKCESEL